MHRCGGVAALLIVDSVVLDVGGGSGDVQGSHYCLLHVRAVLHAQVLSRGMG